MQLYNLLYITSGITYLALHHVFMNLIHEGYYYHFTSHDLAILVAHGVCKSGPSPPLTVSGRVTEYVSCADK